MFRAVGRIFRTPDLRRKIGFTILIVAIFRLGSFIPAPFVDFQNVQTCLAANSNTSGLYELVNLFSGGALLQLSIFALGIMPYITASIIVQLLRVVIPHFDTLYKEGQSGQSKLTQYTRYLTIGLGVLQSTTLITVARSGALFGTSSSTPQCSELITSAGQTWYGILLMVITMTAGTGIIMWMGELVTERGIGNGMSLLIFTSIAARFPSALQSIWLSKGFPVFLLTIAVGIVIMGLVVFVEQSQRRIPVQYPKRQVGNRMFGGDSTHMPLKINTSGVIPPIFASSILLVPATIAGFSQGGPGWLQFIGNQLAHGQPLYMALYAFMIIFFSYFYTAVVFNPEETADNLKKYGGFIPGIRPGSATAEYFDRVLTRLTTVGGIYLVVICLLPEILINNYGLPFYFGGTSILIVVSVTMDTVTQIQSHLLAHQYEGLIRKAKVKGRR